MREDWKRRVLKGVPGVRSEAHRELGVVCYQRDAGTQLRACDVLSVDCVLSHCRVPAPSDVKTHLVKGVSCCGEQRKC